FAEVGFNGQTRQLAERLGITQPLLYRYFPTKKDLIERVFAEVFLKRVDPGWDQLIHDRSRSLEDRLLEFYQRYSRATYTYEWIRIYMFSALMGNNINRRYIKIVEAQILKPICAELRHACGLPARSASEVADAAELVLTSLPSAAALAATIDGVVQKPRRNLVVAELSTLPIDVKLDARDRLAGAGITLLDCPLSGTGAQAA